MPTYHYTAKNIAGKLKEGKRFARDKSELAQGLRAEGFILTTVKVGKVVRVLSIFSFLSRVTLVEKIFFTKHLSVMLSAGVGLPKALENLKKMSRSAVFQKIIGRIKTDVQKGVSTSQAFAKFPKAFGELFVNMIKVGEEGGNLEEVLGLLSLQMKRQYEITQKVKGALMYPAVIVVAMGGIGTGMMLFVVPKMLSIFEEMEVELPWTTKVVISATKFLQNYGILMFIGVALVIILLRFYTKKQKAGKRLVSKATLKLPILGKILRKLNLARFSRTFGALVKGGLPITKALQVSSHTLGNICYQESLEEARENLKKGVSLTEALAKFPKLYSPLVVQMISVGEETGTLTDVLERLADFYEEEVADVTKNLASIIEPILMLLIGAVVGFFAVSMITPIYSMMGQM